VSGASNTQNTQLFLTELGLSTFTIWIDVLNEVPPLSPPSLTHISFGGIIPLCQMEYHALQIIDENQRCWSQLIIPTPDFERKRDNFTFNWH
jgi:hypothetical protein